jgi:hypothetical protein
VFPLSSSSTCIRPSSSYSSSPPSSSPFYSMFYKAVSTQDVANPVSPLLVFCMLDVNLLLQSM